MSQEVTTAASAQAAPSAEEPRDVVRLAVFDFDGTLIDAQSGTQFTKYLFDRRMISLSSTAKVILWGLRYVLHLPHDQDVVRQYIIEDLSHHTRDEVLDVMERFHDEVLTRYYRAAALRQLSRCHEEGCVCVLASATFWGIARAAAGYVGLDAFLATRMEVDDEGRFTGRVLGTVVEGPEKPRAVARWADETFGAGNWRVEYAFGDHHSDEEMLEAARRPFAVNPGRTLKAIAKRRGWPVLEWN